MAVSNQNGQWLIYTAIYILLARLIVSRLRGLQRDICFGLLNASLFLVLFFPDRFLAFAFLLSVLISYAALRLFADKSGWIPWLAFFTPIGILILVRYFFIPAYTAHQSVAYFIAYGSPQFLGISYLAFRNSHLVLQIRNGIVKKPGFWAYIGYSFFLPTMLVGPINPYSNYRLGLDEAPPAIPAGRAALRFLKGAVKYEFLGNIANRLTYVGLLNDDHYHPRIDLAVAVLFYYLFLYCNFSGFCDMAIGAAGLIGIPVAENFENPFAARNVKDFWNRWHITLSQYMRDVVFAPVSKFFVRLLGPSNSNHAIALTITLVFLLIGVWHGVGWNYAAYGAAHALGVTVNHYYTIGLKSRLGRDGFKAYNANPWIHGAAVVMTFCFCAATLFLFANTFPQMKAILSILK